MALRPITFVHRSSRGDPRSAILRRRTGDAMRWTSHPHLTALALASGLLLSACGTGSLPTSGDDDSADTEPSESPQDTFVLPDLDDTGTDTSTPDDTAPPDTDPHTGLLDTGGCTFGETRDCDGVCFPNHFIGDGYCDDGQSLPANFNCPAFNYDEGDCPAGPQVGCEYMILFTPRQWANEIFWELENPAGQVFARVTAGTYTANGRVYRHPVRLTEGTYVFRGHDVFGDGWHRAEWQLVDARTGRLIYANHPEDFTASTGSPPGVNFDWTFNVDCVRTRCSVQVQVEPSTSPTSPATDMGWELWSTTPGIPPVLLTPAGAQPPGSILPGSSSLRLDLYEARYELRTRSSQSTGWLGGTLSVRYDNGWLGQVASVPQGARTDTIDFVHACERHDTPAVQTTIPRVEPPSCQGLRVETRTRTRGSEVGWEIRGQPSFQRVRQLTPGSMASNEVRTDPITLSSGRYLVRMTDTGGDGWAAGHLRLLGPNPRDIYVDLTLPTGRQGAAWFDLDCPVSPPDTGDTDDAGPRECLAGATPDCQGACMPTSLIGDGTCDDGVQTAVDFNCEAFDWDGGDCPSPTPDTDTDAQGDTDVQGDTDASIP